MFRDESDNVIGKAEKAKAKREPKLKSTPPDKPSTPIPSHVPDGFDLFIAKETMSSPSQAFLDGRSAFNIKSMLMPCHVMYPTLDERSLAVFGTLAPTLFRTVDLVDGLCKQGDMQDHVRASMTAVGLACFSNASHAPELLPKAQREYVTALRLTNAALRSPTSAKNDSTLFSVMVLSLYEMITGSNERSLDSWAEHIKGAAALVKLRGPEQFDTLVGQRMFLLVSSNLMLSCIQRTIPMPEEMIKLRKVAEKYMDQGSAAWNLTSIIIDFTIFRAAARDCEIVGPRNVVNAALEIDARFIQGINDLPESWRCTTVYTDDNPHLIWNGCYTVYPQYWMAHVWNGVRTCRIMLHEMIRDQLLSASFAITPIFTDEESEAQLDSSISVMLGMQAEILASVPQHTPSHINEVSSSLLDGSRSYFVIWPLYLVGAMDLSSDVIRTWVIARLRDIGNTIGIRQASVVANYLASRQDFKVWDTKQSPILQRPLRLRNTLPWADQRLAT